MTNTKYSISAAHRITGKSRTTIAKHIAQGKLSVEVDLAGNKLIDAAELIRVYADECRFDRVEEGPEQLAPPLTSGSAGSFAELERVQELLEREMAERIREREQTRERIEHLQDSLVRSQEGHNRATLLLEHHQSQGRGEWERALQLLEDRMAQQEQKLQAELRDLRETAARKIGKYKQALEAERGKGFWRRMVAK